MILEGSVLLLNNRDELVQSSNQGLVGASSLFSEERWHSYQIKTENRVSVLTIDSTSFSPIAKNYPELMNFLYKQALDLDLLLLHQKSTVNNLISRVNLIPYLPLLQQVYFEPGLYSSKSFIKSKKFLILYKGVIIHSSGKELITGQVYDYSTLPSDGEWLSMSLIHLFFYQESEDIVADNLSVNSEALEQIIFSNNSNRRFINDPWEFLKYQNRLLLSLSKKILLNFDSIMYFLKRLINTEEIN